MSAWHPGKMITQERAASVARALFPDLFAYHRLDRRCWPDLPPDPLWADKVREVRHAMLRAFGDDPDKVEAIEARASLDRGAAAVR